MAELKNETRGFLITFWYEYKSLGKPISGYVNVHVTVAGDSYPEFQYIQEVAKDKLEKIRGKSIDENNLSLAITYIHEFPDFDQYAVFHGIGKQLEN